MSIGNRRLITRVLLLLLISVMLFAGTGISASQQEELYFTILHTNDEHSALLPTPLVDYDPDSPGATEGGFARLARKVTDIREAKAQEDEPVLLLSGGDYLGESPYAWLAFRNLAAELTLMQKLGYDVVTIGNHEFDFGPEVLADYYKAAGYPEAGQQTVIVATNTTYPEDHPLAEKGIKDTYIKKLDNGLVVGFFGLLGEDATMMVRMKGEVEFTDQQEAAKAAVESLRQAGADLVIAVNHAGDKEDPELAAAVPGIDVIVSGHTHTSLFEPIIVNDTVIVQAGSNMQYLGVLELAYSPGTGKLRVRNSDTGQPYLVPIDNQVPEHPDFITLLEPYTLELNRMVSELTGGRVSAIDDIIAVSDFDVELWGGAEAPLGNFVTDALRLVASEVLGERVDFAFQACGTIRDSLRIGKTEAAKGGIAFYDLAQLVGLGSGKDNNPGFALISTYLTGDEIIKIVEISAFLSEYMGKDYFLQASGLRADYDLNRAILMYIPFTDLPIPPARAVLSLERYTGEGIQGDDDSTYEPIHRGDKNLYHVVTDYAIATAVPEVGEAVPWLMLQPKDKEGNPVELDDCIIWQGDQELKVWEAVVEYTLQQPVDASAGKPRIPEVYAAPAGRLVETKGMSLWLWPAIVALLLAAVIVLLVRRGKLKKQAKAADKGR